MFVLFPFEEEMYNKEGVSAEFLGHPFVETVRPTMSREEAIQEFSLDPERKTIGLLPGSRNNEIQFLLNLMIDSAGEIRKEIKNSQFILPVADTLDPEVIRQRLKSNPLDIRVVTGKSYDVMNCCDYLIVASGSATLEAGLMGCPMVIVYRLKWITYWLARLLLNTKVYGLVNIVAGEKVVPELIQNKATAKNVADEALKVLDDPEKHRILRSRLFQVRGSLGQPGVMGRIAGRIFKVLQEPPLHEKISV
jgi:lipid-A-disaccharide synthase